MSEIKDSKKYYKVPESLLKQAEERGYKPVTWKEQTVFDPYYDQMEDHWSSSTSFVNFWAFKDSMPMYYKIYKGFVLLMNYLCTDGYPLAVPCLGKYTKEAVADCIAELKRDFDFLGYPLVFMDITPWMLPYYTEAGIEFDIEDDRDYRDYIFTPEEFLAGMEKQDDRYRYRYFMRKYEYETLELTEALADECRQFMNEHWCGVKEVCDVCHYGCLKQVIDNLLLVFDRVRCNGILVRVNGAPAGLCVVSVRNGLGIYQYKNAINRIKGLNEYLLRECFDRYMNGVVDTINYTEDMGMESLRYYKEHMAPSYGLLSKLTLREKESIK